MNYGDSVKRSTSTGRQETVQLPPIDTLHLTGAKIDSSGRISGFHVLPAGIPLSGSRNPVTLPIGSVKVVDASGTAIHRASVRITPRKVPLTGHDTLEAKVEILDSTGMVLATSSHKTFFPENWTLAQIEKATYDAFVEAYQRGKGPIGAVAGTTTEGTKLNIVVKGTMSASNTTLKSISTSHPLPGQTLDVHNQP